METALKISEFCARWNISRASFYNMQARGDGPEITKVGLSPRITPQAEAAWAEKMRAKKAPVRKRAEPPVVAPVDPSELERLQIEEVEMKKKLQKLRLAKLQLRKRIESARVTESSAG